MVGIKGGGGPVKISGVLFSIKSFIPSKNWVLFTSAIFGMAGCATPAPTPKTVDAPPAVAQSQVQIAAAVPQQKSFKRKIAVGRFTNETNYGKALLTGKELDHLGKQTSDMLSARLVESGHFLVFERPDIGLVKGEQALVGAKGNIVGVDALIVGSLTEFGRATEGQAGFLSNTKKQVARAKVEVRLVDTKTGLVFFSASGSGEAAVEAGTVMGFGDKAGYDATLNDRSIGAAISDLMNSIVTKLDERPWRSDILKVEGSRVFITGGTRQGLKTGDRLVVMRSGQVIRSNQSGLDIDLPPTQLAEIEVESSFGTDQTNEGSVARIVSGNVPSNEVSKLFVAEAH
jgi:curli biogenesis system outer membrane secretion channel CsgG